jgi:hypothetical protein
MNIDYIKHSTLSKLEGYEFHYSSFPNGDFGSLERVEFENGIKFGTIDLWSKGWISIDIYDSELDEQIMNVLLSPSEVTQWEKIMENFHRFLNIEQ